jgi:glycosyltransferase involved in cell wall biosynthesis
VNTKTQHFLIPAMAYDNGKSGIAEYTNRLVEALSSEAKVTVVILEKDKHIFPLEASDTLNFIYASNVFSHPVMNILWHFLLLPFMTLNKRYTNLVLPALNRRTSLWSALPTIGIAHDLSQFNVTAKYDLARMLYVKALLPLLLKSVNQVIAISQNTRKDLLRFWNMDSSKISVCYNGYNRERYNDQAPANVEEVLAHYKLERPYLLYVSRIEHPGKNHARLIQAFDQVNDSLPEDYDLVFAGSDWNGADAVKDIARHAKTAKRIHFLGFVPIDHLPALYHGSTLNVIPSLYEGFGIPLVEGMACGIPSICSNNSSLGEIASNAALTFNPSEVSEISNKLALCLGDKTLQQQLTNAGLKHCRKFSWMRLAEHIMSLSTERKANRTSKLHLKSH